MGDDGLRKQNLGCFSVVDNPFAGRTSASAIDGVNVFRLVTHNLSERTKAKNILRWSAVSFSFRATIQVTVTVLVAVSIVTAVDQAHCSQGPPPRQPSTTKIEFEVASVRQNKTDEPPSMNIDPTLQDGPAQAGGLFRAKNVKLVQFISFAWKLTLAQLQSVVSQAPWIDEDRFDIEARAEGNPTKDQYRLMMQSLLADRFKLAMSFESRIMPRYALVLVRPGKFGPQLRLHRADDPFCNPETAQAPSNTGGAPNYQTDADGYPETCGGPFRMKATNPGRMKSGGRDVAMSRFAAVITGVGAVDRPLVDETGIKGNVDYFLEWAKVQANVGYGTRFEPDESAPTFEEALRQQLGLRMVSEKGPVTLVRIDHIEHLAPN